MKNNIGEVRYTKRAWGGLKSNEMVTIIDRKKIGRNTLVTVVNVNGDVEKWISVKLLRKRSR